MTWIQKFISRLADLAFVRKAMDDRADLSAFKERPTLKGILGVCLIGFSYLIGWPLVGLLASLSVYYHEPMLIVVGGPLAYGLSHLVFLVGMYVAGAKYTWIFLRWLTRMAMIKLMQKFPNTTATENHRLR
jgi:hypothetical protein